MANHASSAHLGRKGTMWASAAAAIVLLVAVAYWRSGNTATAFNWPYLHPEGGIGYQFWSGIGSDVGQVTLLGAVIALWSKHNCHIHRCWRLSWHPSKKYGGHVVSSAATTTKTPAPTSSKNNRNERQSTGRRPQAIHGPGGLSFGR